MKKLPSFLLSATLIFAHQLASSQCTINTGNTMMGFTPTSLPCITQGSAYGQAVQYKMPNTIQGLSIDSVTINSISGVPAGITYTPTDAFPHGVGCIWFSGNTNAPVGNYPLTFNVTLYVGLALTGTLNSLTGDSIILTVCPPTTTPAPAFSWSKTMSCDSSVLTLFRDSSTNNPTSRMWSFQGGTPDTSSLKNPLVTFYTNGPHPVKLIVSNAIGTDSITKTDTVIMGGFGNVTLHLTTTGNGCANRDTLTLSGITGQGQASITWWQNATQVYSVAPTQFISTIAGGNGSGFAANQLSEPRGVYVDGGGNIYVADASNNRIQKFPAGSNSATNGTTVAGGNGQGSNANQLYSPWGIYVDSGGNIYVADMGNARIQKFPAGSTSASNGITVAGGNGQGSNANQFADPSSVYVDGGGNIYVADWNNNRIQVFPAGSTPATYGTTVAGGNGRGSNANQFNSPASVCVDDYDNIYVADLGNNRIQKFPAGSTSATSGITVTAAQNSEPSGVYVDGSGNIYVADAGNLLIQKIPTGTTTGTTVASGYSSNGVFVDGLGNIYFSDAGNLSIHELSNEIYDSLLPAQPGLYDAKVTTYGGCSYISNAIMISPIVTPSVNVRSQYAPVCINYTDTFIAYPFNGGLSPSYQWIKDGTNVGINSPLYADGSLHIGDTIYCKMASSYECLTVGDQVVNSNTLVDEAICSADVMVQATRRINYFDTITVNVSVVNANNLFSFFGYLNFDATYLQLINSTPGDFLGNNVLSQPPVVTGGSIDFGMTKINGQSGSTGNGLIYSFQFVLTHLPNIPFNANAPDSTYTTFTFSNPTVNDTGGALDTVGVPLPDTTWLYYYVPVWPGDLNNNGIVDVSDILPIGYFFGKTGPVRPNASISWDAQPAQLFGFDKTNTNSSAYETFADGNGDGIINLADQTSIGFNLSNYHLLPHWLSTQQSNARSVNPPLQAYTVETQIDSTQLPYLLNVKIELGAQSQPVDSVLGVALDLDFDVECVDTTLLNASAVTYSNLFGTVGVNCTHIADFSHKSQGRISFGITRYGAGTVTAQGDTVLTVQFKLTSGCYGGWFRAEPYVIACDSADGGPIALSVITDSVRIIAPQPVQTAIDEPTAGVLILYPNPNTGSFILESKDMQGAEFRIYDMLGRQIEKGIITGSKQMILSNAYNGVYHIALKPMDGETTTLRYEVIK